MFTTIFHYQATDVDSNPVRVCACGYARALVCVKIIGDHRVAAYLVDTNTHSLLIQVLLLVRKTA